MIRYWFDGYDVQYELELEGQQAGAGGFANEASIHTMASNLKDTGWSVTVEKGRYERVWVPDGV